jgi:hypothetical protein
MSAACAEVIAERRMGAFGPTVAIIACRAVVAAAMAMAEEFARTPCSARA